MARATLHTRVGLALGAGGTKGSAHVGVLKVLSEAGVPIDCIAGASIGALYGAPFALGHDPQEIEHNIRRTSPRDVLRFFRHRLTIGPENPLGERFHRALDGVRFEDLEVPFAVVASDVLRREPVLIREGEVMPAVQASISLPVLARPVRWGDRYLVDGGYWESAPRARARTPTRRRAGSVRSDLARHPNGRLITPGIFMHRLGVDKSSWVGTMGLPFGDCLRGGDNSSSSDWASSVPVEVARTGHAGSWRRRGRRLPGSARYPGGHVNGDRQGAVAVVYLSKEPSSLA